MYHEKKYLQFNNLVFDGYDMISEYDESTSYKNTMTAYSYGHGSYFPLRNENLFVSEGSVTMTLTLKTKKLPCEDREFYVRFAEQELAKPGKLWAIKNNEVLWANAFVRSFHPIRSNTPYRVEYDIEFSIPEGIWHKADKQRTFVLPYDVCLFMDCKGYQKWNPCADALGADCCTACTDNKWYQDMADRCFCCCVDAITADMALCFHQDSLQKFYTCDTPFQLVYDCDSAEKFKTNPFIGRKLCVRDMCDSNMIAGRIYSETDLVTENFNITIRGKMLNPAIEINDNLNIIEGEYDGELEILASGDVFYNGELLDPSVWTIPVNMDYGWKIYPQNNKIIVNLNTCCTGATCVFIDIDEITM